MPESRTADGMRILVWRDALSSDECDQICSLVPPKRQAFFEDLDASQQVASLLEQRMIDNPLVIERWERWLTLSNNNDALDWHVDTVLTGSAATHKTLVYMDSVAGTLFSKRECVLIEPSRGTIVLFDIQIEHRGQPFDRRLTKRTVGLRTVARPR